MSEIDFWNIKELPPPPFSSSTLTTKDIDIRLLEICLKDSIKFFENQQQLATEAALLSRTVYRLKMKFRSSKDFLTVEKLSRALRTYLQMHIPQVLNSLLRCIPHNYKANKTYSLTKNMIDFVLVRLQGLGKILCRIVETCKISSTFMQLRLRLGHFWKLAFLILAATSRIFIISKFILKYVCEMYTKILPFSSSLANSGVQWLSEDYYLPNRLDEWLNIDWLELDNNIIEIPDDDPNLSYFKLTDSDDDIEFCDEYILIKDDSFMQEPTISDRNSNVSVIKIENSSSSDLSEDDVGVEVATPVNLKKKQTPKGTKRKRTKHHEHAHGARTVQGGTKLKTPKNKKNKKRKKVLGGSSFNDLSDVGIDVSTPVNSRTKQTPKRKRTTFHERVRNARVVQRGTKFNTAKNKKNNQKLKDVLPEVKSIPRTWEANPKIDKNESWSSLLINSTKQYKSILGE